MSCTQTKAWIDDYLDGELGPSRKTRLAEHVRACEQCRAALEQAEGLRDAMRALPVDPPRPGFAGQALRRARRMNETRHRVGFLKGFATAAAAGLILWLGSGLLFTPAPPDIHGSPGEMTVAVSETRRIDLVLETPQAIEGATIRMILPPNVELDGYSGRRELSWRTDLVAGANLLSLPVIGTAAGRGELVAEVAHDRDVKVFRLRLLVEDSSAVRGHEGTMVAL